MIEEDGAEHECYLLTLIEWQSWVIRAIIAVALLVPTALVIKPLIVEEEAVLEFNIRFEEVDRTLKGDREI